MANKAVAVAKGPRHTPTGWCVKRQTDDQDAEPEVIVDNLATREEAVAKAEELNGE
tara:strand:+ start:344 stop:511 length:168 start_codon:yes stop_codon:yes gene_type:complete